MRRQRDFLRAFFQRTPSRGKVAPSRSRPRLSTIRFCRWCAIPTRAVFPRPGLPLPQHRFRHPEDAREQLKRGLDMHQEVFGIRPAGVWPSEGSVSEEVLSIAAELGVKWMATDEGVLGRTIGTHFERPQEGRLKPDSAESFTRRICTARVTRKCEWSSATIRSAT